MPLDFPTIESVIRRVCAPDDPSRVRSNVHYFRRPEEGETEDSYRHAAADFVRDVRGDPVEASEIRTGRGWDRQLPEETLREIPDGLGLLMLLRSMQSANSRRPAAE